MVMSGDIQEMRIVLFGLNVLQRPFLQHPKSTTILEDNIQHFKETKFGVYLVTLIDQLNCSCHSISLHNILILEKLTPLL